MTEHQALTVATEQGARPDAEIFFDAEIFLPTAQEARPDAEISSRTIKEARRPSEGWDPAHPNSDQAFSALIARRRIAIMVSA